MGSLLTTSTNTADSRTAIDSSPNGNKRFLAVANASGMAGTKIVSVLCCVTDVDGSSNPILNSMVPA